MEQEFQRRNKGLGLSPQEMAERWHKLKAEMAEMQAIERERETETETEKEGERERERGEKLKAEMAEMQASRAPHG